MGLGVLLWKKKTLALALSAALLAAPAAAQDTDTLTWARATTCPLIRDYLTRFPGGRYVAQAREQLRARNCPDPEAEARRRAEAAKAEQERLQRETVAASQGRARAEQEAQDLRNRLAREEESRRAAEQRAAEETRKRQAAETARPATAPSFAAFDLAQLHPDVRRAVESARAAETRAVGFAVRARDTARQAEASGLVSPQSGLGAQSYSGDFAGNRYVGQFVGGAPSGIGVEYMALNTVNTSGSLRYEGEFSGGRRNGDGVYYWHDGRFAGNFRDNMRNGYGVFRFTDGRRSEGQYVNDKRSGYAVVWAVDGRVSQSGIWTDGTLTTPLAR